MSCRFCDTGSPKDKDNIHHMVTGPYMCETPTPRPAKYGQISDQEKRELFIVIDLASEIRMSHDFSLWGSIDMVKKNKWIFQALEGAVKTKEKVIEQILENEGHTCNPKCTEAKVVT